MGLAGFLLALAVLLIAGAVGYAFKHKTWSKQASTTVGVALVLLFVSGLLSNAAEAPHDVPDAAREQSAQTETQQAKVPERPSAETDAPAPQNDTPQPKHETPAQPASTSAEEIHQTIPDVPADATYVTVNDNIPAFTNDDLTETEPYATYGELDRLGRVTAANALLDVSLMPPQQRGETDRSIKPSGWHQARYPDVVPNGGWLYNRSHLIGFQLAGSENDPKNLMTGTRWLNAEGMLPFENFVADYVERTEDRVRYRVTPAFVGNERLARGVFMEGYSVDDDGASIQFHIFIPNRQPGVTIDYQTGDSQAD